MPTLEERNQKLLSEQAAKDPRFEKASYMQALREHTTNSGKGLLAGLAGFPVDLGIQAHDLLASALVARPVDDPAKVPGSSEWIGNRIGADTDRASFIAGTFGAPDVTDIKKAMFLGVGRIADVKSAFGQTKIDNLFGAEAATKAGADPQAVWQEHGWFKDIDGNWKFEVDDSQAQLTDWYDRFSSGRVKLEHVNNSTFTAVRFAEILHHPELFKVYPELANLGVKVSARRNSGSALQIYDATRSPKGSLVGGNQMNIYNIEDVDEFKSVLLHEAQHWVQEMEGFARGGTAPTGLAEVAENVHLNRLLQGSGGEVFTEEQAFQYFSDQGFPESKAKDLMEEYSIFVRTEQVDPDQYQVMLGQLQVVQDQGIEKLTSIINAVDSRSLQDAGIVADYVADLKELKRLPYEYYFRLAGEVESRTVESRLLLTAREKARIPPNSFEQALMTPGKITPEARIVNKDVMFTPDEIPNR